MAMEDSPERRSAVKEAGAGPAQRPARPRGARRPFWFFAAAMLVAVAGGGAVVVMVKRTSAERRYFARDPGAAVEPAAARRARAAALVSQAEARRRAQDVSAAIPLYLAALEADPDLVELHRELARCYQLQGDEAHAAERYRRYLATDPPDADQVKDLLRTLE